MARYSPYAVTEAFADTSDFGVPTAGVSLCEIPAEVSHKQTNNPQRLPATYFRTAGLHAVSSMFIRTLVCASHVLHAETKR